jgi:hypothetical protein
LLNTSPNIEHLRNIVSLNSRFVIQLCSANPAAALKMWLSYVLQGGFWHFLQKEAQPSSAHQGFKNRYQWKTRPGLVWSKTRVAKKRSKLSKT